MSLLKRIKYVDQTTKDAVFGYVRRIEKELIKTNNIPIAITHLFLAYYYFPEYFDKAREDSFEISEDKLTITSIKFCQFGDHTIFMKYRIDSLSNRTIKWTFKLNKLGVYSDYHPMYFGLVSCSYSDILLQGDFSTSKRPNYSISCDGARTANYIHRTKIEGLSFDEEDTVTFTLNLPQSSFSCTINNNKDTVIYDDIKKETDIYYTFVMQLQNKDDSITLLNFIIS